jgi:P27 family predicted phage terminase small subunit
VKRNGPPPQPATLRLLRGNPGKRPLPEPGLKPAPGARCPKQLSPAAKVLWRRLEPELERLNNLAFIDREKFAAYCEAWADFVWAIDDIKRGGQTATSDKGYEYERPAVRIKARAMKILKALGDDFGFSPLARKHLSFEGPEGDADDESRFFGPAGPRPAPPPPPARPTRPRRRPSPA